jgi:hypothetical protein
METLPGQHHPRIEDEHSTADKGLELTGHGNQDRESGLRRTPQCNLVAIMRRPFRNVNNFPAGQFLFSSNRLAAAPEPTGRQIGLPSPPDDSSVRLRVDQPFGIARRQVTAPWGELSAPCTKTV